MPRGRADAQSHKREDTKMDSSEKTRLLEPVFVEKVEGKDIKSLLYVKNDKGAFVSLAEIQSSSETEESAEIPGMLTTNIVETSSAERGTTITSVSVSPFRLCCVVVGGFKVCFNC